MPLSIQERNVKLFESKLTSYLDKIKSILNKVSQADKIGCVVFMEEAESLKNLYYATMDKYQEVKLELDETYIPNFAHDEFDVTYQSIKYIYIKSKTTNEIKVEQTTQIKTCPPKLPPLKLPMFSGKVSEWILFYDTFSREIDNNDELSDAEKVQYLVGQLSGRALRTIKRVPPTPDNYSVIWEMLTDKYQDDRVMATYYIDQLLNLSKVNGPSDLEVFMDKFLSSVSALKQLQLENLLEFFLIRLGSSKLDKQTINGFETSVILMGKKGIPSFDDFSSYISERVKLLSRTSQSVDVSNQRPQQKLYASI